MSSEWRESERRHPVSGVVLSSMPLWPVLSFAHCPPSVSACTAWALLSLRLGKRGREGGRGEEVGEGEEEEGKDG